MKNAMQLKTLVKNIADQKKISAQLVLQNYMLERFLERASVSEYQNMNQQWHNYQKNFNYAVDIRFADTCNAVIKLMERLPEV